jgi:hypothetical protein
VTVGTNVGEIGLWEVGSRERLVLRNFKVWDLNACSMPLQVFFFFFFYTHSTDYHVYCMLDAWCTGMSEIELSFLFG